MRPKTLGRVLAVLVVLVCAVGANKVMAQLGGSGGIQGSITDPGGAVVPGATVVATNVGTGVATTRQTNDAGLYVIKPLPPGEYKLVVSLTGFLTLIQEKVVVDALSTVTVDLALKVGDVKETDRIITIEGLSRNSSHPVQKAWAALDVPQCGYCQSGQIMAAAALLRRTPKPTDKDIDEAMTNICRCGTYQRIRAAVHIAANDTSRI